MTTRIKIPERYSKILANSKCYVGLMGISIGKIDFMNPQIMMEYSRFMQEKFQFSLLIIGDLPKKYNIMALEGVSEKKAEEKTRAAGNDMLGMLEKITANFPLVKVSRWRNHMGERYARNLKILQESYANNDKFRASSNDLVNDFLSLPLNRVKWKTSEPPTNIAKNYLLDELAGLLSIPFIFELPVCEIYPGRSEVHERVQNREFPFCKDLHIRDDRVFMEAYYEPSN